MCKNFYMNHRGITSLEVVIGISIAALIIAFSANAVTLFLTSAREVTERTQALYLAEEGLELVRYIRDEDWNEIAGLTTNDTHYLDVSAGSIGITGSPETIGDFSRSFTVSNVYRDATTDDIVASTTGGSVADTGAKYVTVTVNWNSGVDSVSLATILAEINP